MKERRQEREVRDEKVSKKRKEREEVMIWIGSLFINVIFQFLRCEGRKDESKKELGKAVE